MGLTTSQASRTLRWLVATCAFLVCQLLQAQTPIDWTSKTIQEIQQAAEKGDATAQSALGNAYLVGEKVAPNATLAVKWYKAAAEQNDPISQFALGMLYEEGNGVAKSMPEAAKWYKAAAERGLAEAQYNIGACYSSGEGVELNQAEAVKWYRKAAEQREVRAETQLGRAYREGLGITKDLAESFRWFKRAAYQDEPSAQFFVGLANSEGEGTERDVAEAMKWFKRSAEQNYPDAQYYLGQNLLRGEGGEANPAEAVKYLRLAAQQGHVQARYLLGQAYKNGQGVEANKDEAIKWLRLAAANSHVGALKSLLELGVTNAVYKPMAFTTPINKGAEVAAPAVTSEGSNSVAVTEAPKSVTKETTETNKVVAAAPEVNRPPAVSNSVPQTEGVTVPYGLLTIGIFLLGVIAVTSTLLLFQVKGRLKHMEVEVKETRLQLAEAGNHLNSLLRYVEARAMSERADKLAVKAAPTAATPQLASSTPAAPPTTQYKARRGANPASGSTQTKA